MSVGASYHPDPNGSKSSLTSWAYRLLKRLGGAPPVVSEHINNAEKTETQTREQVIHGIFDEM